ncbi:type II toxin-antitoxin system TacA family antitoxin [Cupriavidus necator]|uniref:type II toxin-antitoxin system TacA family antitoxin n=1 Tax=Cupriavidus necator TaxID=106590 RepID=UPI000FB95FF9
MPATSRFEARLSAEAHALIKRAAELEGRSMTDFVLTAARDAARRTIENADIIALSLADQESFANALMAPPQAGAALERAAVRRRKLLRAE